MATVASRIDRAQPDSSQTCVKHTMNIPPLYLVIYLVGINLITFGAYAFDKRCACTRKRRVSESGLLLLALIGGSPMAWLAQQLLRHKTKKGSFRLRFWMIVALQVVVVAVVVIKANGWDKVQ